MRTAHSLTVSCSIRWGGVCPTPLDADPLEPDPPPEADPYPTRGRPPSDQNDTQV